MGLELSFSRGRSWFLSGTTDSTGTVSFTVQKPPIGDYLATVTRLTASGYMWDTALGITSASYASTKPAGKN